MREKEFNLIEEPWILALSLDGKPVQLSLMALFGQAHRLYGLAGEMDAQDIALLRVLLAILYAVFGRQDLQGMAGVPHSEAEACSRWQALWDAGQFPMDRMEAYLLGDGVRERFYLFHPHTPFMQVALDQEPTIQINGQTLSINPLVKPIKALIGDLSESENKPHLFSNRTNRETLSCPEAARWLIHLNSYDVSPLGAPPREGFRAKGFKEPWPNKLGLVWAQGENLFETLMLNFVLAPSGMDLWEDFLPAWEWEEGFRPEVLAQVETDFPNDPCELFAFPFRRLQLQRDDAGQVRECTLWGGHLVAAENGNPLTETMTLWKKDKEGRHVPRQHDPARQMWRDFGALFSAAQANPPGIVSWLSRLKRAGCLNLPMLRLNIGGVVLSGKKTSIDDTVSDSLRFHSALLMDLAEGWPARINRELEQTVKGVWRAGKLAGGLVIAGGGSGEKDTKAAEAKARAEGYFMLDSPFRQWLESLDDTTDMDVACRAWRDTQAQLFRRFGQEMVQRAGLKALVGRSIKERPGDTRERLYAAPDLYNQFVRYINKILKE